MAQAAVSGRDEDEVDPAQPSVALVAEGDRDERKRPDPFLDRRRLDRGRGQREDGRENGADQNRTPAPKDTKVRAAAPPPGL